MATEQGRQRTQAARVASLAARQHRKDRAAAEDLRTRGWVCIPDAIVTSTTYQEGWVTSVVVARVAES